LTGLFFIIIGQQKKITGNHQTICPYVAKMTYQHMKMVGQQRVGGGQQVKNSGHHGMLTG